jgi:hypothetical protein
MQFTSNRRHGSHLVPFWFPDEVINIAHFQKLAESRAKSFGCPFFDDLNERAASGTVSPHAF